jgi:hypothetical protein
MSTLLDEPIDQGSTRPAAQRLRTTMAAVRVSMSWFGTRKTLMAEQRAEAAEPCREEGLCQLCHEKQRNKEHEHDSSEDARNKPVAAGA